MTKIEQLRNIYKGTSCIASRSYHIRAFLMLDEENKLYLFRSQNYVKSHGPGAAANAVDRGVSAAVIRRLKEMDKHFFDPSISIGFLTAITRDEILTHLPGYSTFSDKLKTRTNDVLELLEAKSTIWKLTHIKTGLIAFLSVSSEAIPRVKSKLTQHSYHLMSRRVEFHNPKLHDKFKALVAGPKVKDWDAQVHSTVNSHEVRTICRRLNRESYSQNLTILENAQLELSPIA